jgi:hypothetical protein
MMWTTVNILSKTQLFEGSLQIQTEQVLEPEQSPFAPLNNLAICLAPRNIFF